MIHRGTNRKSARSSRKSAFEKSNSLFTTSSSLPLSLSLSLSLSLFLSLSFLLNLPSSSSFLLHFTSTKPGIPKFYRWLSERYPLVNQPVLGTHVPEVDALYLDMNGIIHNCTHGNDPTSKITETDMILRIFQYLDKLFSIVQPQKLLFMAVDGERVFGVLFS